MLVDLARHHILVLVENLEVAEVVLGCNLAEVVVGDLVAHLLRHDELVLHHDLLVVVEVLRVLGLALALVRNRLWAQDVLWKWARQVHLGFQLLLVLHCYFLVLGCARLVLGGGRLGGWHLTLLTSENDGALSLTLWSLRLLIWVYFKIKSLLRFISGRGRANLMIIKLHIGYTLHHLLCQLVVILNYVGPKHGLGVETHHVGFVRFEVLADYVRILLGLAGLSDSF